eukprot:NODE_6991_length_1618_cov_13.495641.p1 GENE.NODE_6991_length_1618_cov_13.495641~~NODE_6991_length_1618_cov_13.495641.p1  ORF type:complete len:473 (+),score=156.07 NODE_6991_length_1618_cov_13.495641:108-1526(+)
MGAQDAAFSERYSWQVCGIFMLNMVMGTGPMTLPYAFEKAGFVLSALFLFFIMSLSFTTTTFVVEALAHSNGLKKRAADGEGAGPSNAPLLSVAMGCDDEPVEEIQNRYEIGAMAELVMPLPLVLFTYLTIIAYTYGVLTVYAIAASTSISQEVGRIHIPFMEGEQDSYNAFLVLFVVLVSPMCLLNFARTRPLQLAIGAMRIAAVVLMVAIMTRYLARLSEAASTRKLEDIPLWNLDGMPALFGNAAFIFMVHHSLPGLISPLLPHTTHWKASGMAYGISYVLYLLQGFLALWSVGDETLQVCGDSPSRPCRIQPLFNTNFASADWTWVGKLVVCYPVLVVSVFPLVAITLRNNLRALCANCGFGAPSMGRKETLLNCMFTVFAVAPPYMIAFRTKDVQGVMKYVGGYAGLLLMFLIPTLLVLFGRRRAAEKMLPTPALRSVLGSTPFVATVLAFFCVSLSYNTYRLCFMS